ncbi:MAG: hypothetical protein KJ600_03265 [Nanoarchaeota archaeon]|nr:hypothetical protein [Nanoarchaeota archaeon]
MTKLINSDILGFKGMAIASKDKEKIDEIILDYNSGKDKQKQRKKILELIKKYNPKILLVACTELSSLLKTVDINKIDTMKILLNATIRKWSARE